MTLYVTLYGTFRVIQVVAPSLDRSLECSMGRSGQWIVTRARLGNPARVTPYVPVTGYNFIHQVRLKASVFFFENYVQNLGLKILKIWFKIEGRAAPQTPLQY